MKSFSSRGNDTFRTLRGIDLRCKVMKILDLIIVF